ncbi:conserved protein of unknown function [Tepidanaerobacter acetatoxydans Re1]|uniref:Uncharacterized protein n=1 Tax=Tepidanaerobacter acetatoxydans (strain DSM 21804 / JCM 16047 / Re1) TaxID=1209989 RepID=F4LUD3_TEPAE|nr:hypothetical protein [Tepidanaerobacter acetatoxydans]AEE91463.1 hypothetical protein TepRe1_1317 [Tepidanaerobacter acetatoxydans Re1]CCP26169.1 conserved protein of unknown function [Tepidanaerobacter acetatoxydans Re1]
MALEIILLFNCQRPGNAGYVVNLWKRYANEKNEHKVLISSDTYNPTPTLLYVGEKVKEITDDKNINATIIP